MYPEVAGERSEQEEKMWEQGEKRDREDRKE